jgi:hypothetical protein
MSIIPFGGCSKIIRKLARSARGKEMKSEKLRSGSTLSEAHPHLKFIVGRAVVKENCVTIRKNFTSAKAGNN